MAWCHLVETIGHLELRASRENGTRQSVTIPSFKPPRRTITSHKHQKLYHRTRFRVSSCLLQPRSPLSRAPTPTCSGPESSPWPQVIICHLILVYRSFDPFFVFACDKRHATRDARLPTRRPLSQSVPGETIVRLLRTLTPTPTTRARLWLFSTASVLCIAFCRFCLCLPLGLAGARLGRGTANRDFDAYVTALNGLGSVSQY